MICINFKSKHSKKAFTLIELLAVIIILGVIALIATPIVLKVVDNARFNSAKASIYGYIDAIKLNYSEAMMNETLKLNIPSDGILESGDDDDELDKIAVSGRTPDYIYLNFEDGYVKKAGFCIDKYNIKYENFKAEKADIDYCAYTKVESLVVENNNLSVGKGSTYKLEYSISPSDITPMFISSDESIATVDESGMITGLNVGSTVITVKAGIKRAKINVEIKKINDSIIGYVARKTFSNDSVTTIEANGVTYAAHVYNFNGNQTWTGENTFGDSSDVATATTDATRMVVVKVNGDLTIEENAIVQPYYTEYGGPKGFLLYVTGTLTNNGTIDNSHGAKAVGENVYLWKNDDDSYELIPDVGASGATSGSSASSVWYPIGLPGSDGSEKALRATAGGGSGGAYNSKNVGSGTSGTSYSGGTGGGGKGNGEGTSTRINASSNGGSGGTATSHNSNKYCYSGGGAGNPGGLGAGCSNYMNGSFNEGWFITSSGKAGANGTGGLLVIYANSIVNESTAVISAKGSKGGNGSSGAGGGASGGGSINIFYNDSYESDITPSAAGGERSSGDGGGGAGGNGTVTIGSIATDTFIKD